MPFVKKNNLEVSQPPTDARKLFIGRTSELLFFVQNILQPEDPTHNIISISGQGGVGKSTLLARFIDETRTSNFKDYCLTAIVDERQATPASIMEKFANQLHLANKFEQALKRYKQRLRKLETEQESLQETLLQRIPDFAGAAVEGIPFAGPILRETTKVTATHLLNKHYTNRMRTDAIHLENPLDDLTRAFVTELNRLADTPGVLSFKRIKQRVILFFDTFEQLATEAVPWLLDYFLEAEINKNVVLVFAGRDPIEHSAPYDPKRWLPYFDDETIFSISLNSFTEDETRTYLAQRGITDSEHIDTIWQLSRGLPFYLALLTSNPRGKVDPTKDVVANFLRWIPEHEQIKQRLALDAALFSKPFSQDDLEAFTYLSVHDRPTLYHWLIAQPFVRPQDGRYSYHDLAKELFSRYLYQHSRKGYYATRRALAHHYQRLLEEIEGEGGKEIYLLAEWFASILALISQVFLLPDEGSHIKAIELVLFANRSTRYEKWKEIARMLRELSEVSTSGISLHAQQTIRHLYYLIGPFLGGKEGVEASTFLLNTVAGEPSFPPALLGELYGFRGWAYRGLNEHQMAIDDFQYHLTLLDPTDHRGRGLAYWDLDEYQLAISEFNLALELNPRDTRTLGDRGWNYFYLKEYQQAIHDFEHALELNPNDARALNGRGLIHKLFKEYEQAMAHFEHMIEASPTDTQGYMLRGCVYIYLKEYQRAINDFKYVLELDPDHSYVYYLRGYVYLWLKDMKLALADFTRSWELDPAVSFGWMAEWVRMCQLGTSPHMSERLEELIVTTAYPTRYYPRVCQGVVHLLRERYEEALAELEQAIPLSPELEPWDAYFWKGVACVFSGREGEAIEAIEKALEEGLPPVLLAPLHWFEQDRPEFYQRFVVPLLIRYDVYFRITDPGTYC